MKKIMRMIAVSVLLALCMAGCGKMTNKSMSILLNVDTGDAVKVSLDTSDGHTMSFDVQTSILSIADGEGNILARGIFVPQASYSLYYDTAYTDSRCNIIATGKDRGFSYTFYTYDDGTNVNCECIGWIIGSNAGVVLESTELDADSTAGIMEKLSFSVDSTMQINDQYIYEPMVGTNSANASTDSNHADAAYESSHVDMPETDTDVKSGQDGDTEPAVSDNDTHAVGTADWSSMLIKMDGVEYSFPYSLRTLQANGWTFNIEDYLEDGETEYILEEGEYTYSTTLLHNDKYGNSAGSAEIYIGFKNFTETPKNITDCGIWALEISGVYGTTPVKNCPDVELPGGIRFGMSMDDIKAVYGEPDSIDDNEYYIKMNYEKDYSRQMDLYVYTGADGGAEGLLDVEFRCYD